MSKKELLEARRKEDGMKTANEIQLFKRDENIKTNILNIINHPLMKGQKGKPSSTEPFIKNKF